MSDAATKTCSKCGEIKAVELFRDRRNQCKCCEVLAFKVWAKENPEKVKTLKRESYRKNKEKILVAQKKYRQKNIESIREKNRKRSIEYAAKNPEKRRMTRRKTNAKSVERLSQYYVRNLVAASVGIPAELVVDSLIEVKRKHLQILRAMKEKTDEHKVKKSR